MLLSPKLFGLIRYLKMIFWISFFIRHLARGGRPFKSPASDIAKQCYQLECYFPLAIIDYSDSSQETPYVFFFIVFNNFSFSFSLTWPSYRFPIGTSIVLYELYVNMWCVVRFGTIWTILKTWKKPIEC